MVGRSNTMSVSSERKFLPRSREIGKTCAARRHQRGMTLHSARGRGCGNGPPTDARTWRRCRLIEAGLPDALADSVAADPLYDLHALLQLLDRGCPPELAVRITSPLTGEVSP